MKVVLYVILLLVVYQAVKAVFRSAMSGPQRAEGSGTPRAPGEEMVQDPQCRTFVVKGRALARRIDGRMHYFCSAACADAHERGDRS